MTILEAPYPTLVFSISKRGDELIDDLLREWYQREGLRQIKDVAFLVSKHSRTLSESYLEYASTPPLVASAAAPGSAEFFATGKKLLGQLLSLHRERLVGLRCVAVGDLLDHPDTDAPDNTVLLTAQLQAAAEMFTALLETSDQEIAPLVSPVGNQQRFLLMPCDAELPVFRSWNELSNDGEHPLTTGIAGVLCARNRHPRNFAHAELMEESRELLAMLLAESSDSFDQSLLPMPGQIARYMLWKLSDGQDEFTRLQNTAISKSLATFLLSSTPPTTPQGLRQDAAVPVIRMWGERHNVFSMETVPTELDAYQLQRLWLTAQVEKVGTKLIETHVNPDLKGPESFPKSWTNQVLRHLDRELAKALATAPSVAYEAAKNDASFDTEKWLYELEHLHNRDGKGLGIEKLNSVVEGRKQSVQDARDVLTDAYLQRKQQVANYFRAAPGETEANLEQLWTEGARTLGKFPSEYTLSRAIYPLTLAFGTLLTPLLLKAGDVLPPAALPDPFRPLADPGQIWDAVVWIMTSVFQSPVFAFLAGTIFAYWVVRSGVEITRKKARHEREICFGKNGRIASQLMREVKRRGGHYADAIMTFEDQLDSWISASTDQYRRAMELYHHKLLYSKGCLEWLIQQGQLAPKGEWLSMHPPTINAATGNATVRFNHQKDSSQWRFVNVKDSSISWMLVPPSEQIQDSITLNKPGNLWAEGVDPISKSCAEEIFLWPERFDELAAGSAYADMSMGVAEFNSDGTAMLPVLGPGRLPRSVLEQEQYCLLGQQLELRLSKVFDRFKPDELPWGQAQHILSSRRPEHGLIVVRTHLGGS